jgi:hypothetical protein
MVGIGDRGSMRRTDSLLLLAIACLFLWLGIGMYPSLSSEHQHWPTTTGIITNTTVHAVARGDATSMATIQYEVSGKTYELQVGPGHFGSKSQIIRYDPDQPGTAIREPDWYAKLRPCALIGFGILLALIGLYVLLKPRSGPSSAGQVDRTDGSTGEN